MTKSKSTLKQSDSTTNKSDEVSTENINHLFNIKVTHLATYPGNKGGNFIVVDYKDIDDKIHCNFLIPAVIVNDFNKLKNHLIENGISYNLSKNEWDEIKTRLNKKPEGRMQLVNTSGFHNSVFLEPDNNIIGEPDDNKLRPILDPRTRIKFPVLEENGTLEEWQEHIATAAIHSSRIMLAISATFSAAFLHLINIESGGFHLYGKSSTGKTTCKECALSVQGPQSTMETWSITETGVEETAAKFNDSTLFLDELGNLDSNPEKAAQKAGKIIYTLASGKDKRRSSVYANEGLTWRVIVISSGERSLSQHAAAGGTKRNKGEEVRLIDVPADAGEGLGILETTPEGISSSDYIDYLSDMSNKFYGTARKTFIKKLTVYANKNGTDAIKKHIDTLIKKFLEHNSVDESDGPQKRIATKFALAYAGGIFAIKWKILPFETSDVMTGISKCYFDTLEAIPKTDNQLAQEAFEIIRLELKNNKNFLDIQDENHGFSYEELESAFGYKLVVKDSVIKAIRSEKLTQLVPDKKIRVMALKMFKDKGHFLSDAKGKATRQINWHLSSKYKLPRAYCFIVKPKNPE